MKIAICAALLVATFATQANAQSVGGQYRVDGTNFDGSRYTGTASIRRSSDTTCRIHWETGGTSSDGFCMLAKGAFAAAYRLGNAVGLVLYDMQPDGTLKGYWTIADRPGAGTETLTPIR